MPEVWGDASYGGSIVTPYGGGFIRWRNAAVAWISRKLKFIPLSTCEAEVAAMVNILKEAMFVVQVLRDMGHTLSEKLPAITDSKSASNIVQNPAWGDKAHGTFLTVAALGKRIGTQAIGSRLPCADGEDDG